MVSTREYHNMNYLVCLVFLSL